MTKQSTWIPHIPPLKVGDRAKVVSDHYHIPLRGQVGTIVEILNGIESRWIRTDRWSADWYVLEFDDKTIPIEKRGFLEDDLEPIPHENFGGVHFFEALEGIILGHGESVDRMVCSNCHRLLWVDDTSKCEAKIIDGVFHPYIHLQVCKHRTEK